MSAFDWLLCLPAGALVLFMTVPLAVLLVSVPAEEFPREFADARNWRVILNSVVLGAVSAVAATVMGVPLAYLLARREFPGKRFVEGVVELPIAVPHIVIGIALLAALGPRSVAGALLFDWTGLEVVDTWLGVVIAMTAVSIPYIVTNARSGFEAIGDRLEKTALSLGASPAAVFFEITLPLARRQILNGVSLCWGRSISELGAIMILAYHPLTVAVYVWDVRITDGPSRMVAVGAVCLAVYLAAFITFRGLTGGRKRAKG
jgi:molybdate/tungstate transport system permease protein